MKRLIVLAAALTVGASPPKPELVVYGAGSTVGALGAMLDRYAAATGQHARMVNGPAGLLLKRIEAGEHVDLFVSANMAHPERLTREGRSGPTVVFARNALCVTTRPGLGLTSANMLVRMLDPAVRIGTSTPGADPGGDYAWALFDKAGSVNPGATAILKAKAMPLVGGGTPPAGVPKGADAVRWFLQSGRVDMFVGYCSSHDADPKPDPNRVPVPPSLSVPVTYGMTAMRDASPGTEALENYLRGPEAQALLPTYGFIPANAGEIRRR